MTEIVSIAAAPRLEGHVVSPGDKSISHRALLLSALSEGTSSVQGISLGADVGRTRTIIEALGASTSNDGARVLIEGGAARLRPSQRPLDCGNSGTTMRLVMGLVAGFTGTSVLIGDASLSTRPMDRMAEPLELMGATVTGVGERILPPLDVQGRGLRGITYTVPVPSAQVKSGVLLAALAAEGETTVIETTPTRPNTEEMLHQAGIDVRWHHTDAGTEITLSPGQPHATDWLVPADPSQAAFFLVAGLLGGQARVRCTGLYGDPTRVGFLAVLERMGGTLERHHTPDGLLEVQAASSELHGTEIRSSEIPSVDEVPILVVAAAGARGTTRFCDVGELRIKESDRFAGALGLAIGLGARAWAEGDDLCIEGLGSASAFSPMRLDAHGDHRMAMSAAIAGAVGQGATVAGFDSVATSYPGFLDVLDSLR